MKVKVKFKLKLKIIMTTINNFLNRRLPVVDITEQQTFEFMRSRNNRPYDVRFKKYFVDIFVFIGNYQN